MISWIRLISEPIQRGSSGSPVVSASCILSGSNHFIYCNRFFLFLVPFQMHKKATRCSHSLGNQPSWLAFTLRQLAGPVNGYDNLAHPQFLLSSYGACIFMKGRLKFHLWFFLPMSLFYLSSRHMGKKPYGLPRTQADVQSLFLIFLFIPKYLEPIQMVNKIMKATTAMCSILVKSFFKTWTLFPPT